MEIEESQINSLLLTDEEISVTTRANPNCPICHGTGLRPIFDEHMQVRKDTFCKCIYINQRKAAAEARIKRLFGSQWEQYTFAAYDAGGSARNEQALRAAHNYVNEFPAFFAQGYGFGLSGPSRSGKTHLVTATTIALIKRWWIKPFFLSVPKMMRTERERFNDPSIKSPVEEATSADICVLDDLGAEYRKKSDRVDQDLSWAEEQLYLILDERIKKNLPTLYTTNLNEGELQRILQERIYRRIQEATISTYMISPVESKSEPDPKFAKLLSK
jgi:DNA replication protein DnaC